jgi:hypothetical protein
VLQSGVQPFPRLRDVCYSQGSAHGGRDWESFMMIPLPSPREQEYIDLLPSLNSPYRINSASTINYMQTCLLRATTLFPCAMERLMTVVRRPKLLVKWSATLVDGAPRADACGTPVPFIHDVVLQLANRVLGRVKVRIRCRVVHRPHPPCGHLLSSSPCNMGRSLVMRLTCR